MSISMESLGYQRLFPCPICLQSGVLARQQYRALSGAIEVQRQGAAMIAGGLASFLINRVSLT
jgi:hypothetical protein